MASLAYNLVTYVIQRSFLDFEATPKNAFPLLSKTTFFDLLGEKGFEDLPKEKISEKVRSFFDDNYSAISQYDGEQGKKFESIAGKRWPEKLSLDIRKKNKEICHFLEGRKELSTLKKIAEPHVLSGAPIKSPFLIEVSGSKQKEETARPVLSPLPSKKPSFLIEEIDSPAEKETAKPHVLSGSPTKSPFLMGVSGSKSKEETAKPVLSPLPSKKHSFLIEEIDSPAEKETAKLHVLSGASKKSSFLIAEQKSIVKKEHSKGKNDHLIEAFKSKKSDILRNLLDFYSLWIFNRRTELPEDSYNYVNNKIHEHWSNYIESVNFAFSNIQESEFRNMLMQLNIEALNKSKQSINKPGILMGLTGPSSFSKRYMHESIEKALGVLFQKGGHVVGDRDNQEESKSLIRATSKLQKPGKDAPEGVYEIRQPFSGMIDANDWGKAIEKYEDYLFKAKVIY